MATGNIRELSFASFDVPLKEPFGIATGAQVVAENVLVRVELDDGTVGLGEAAPFPAVNGETRARVLDRLSECRGVLSGHSVQRYRRACEALREAFLEVPSALAAVETALLDALCRHFRLSLWSFFGGCESELVTDITVATGDVDHARARAQSAEAAGFRTLKVKVGGVPLALDVERLRTILAAAPNVGVVLDANASLTAEAALALLEALGPARQRIVLFEQPTPAEDLDSLRRVRERSRVRVAADESARSRKDVLALGASGAADVVNIKTMKCGLMESWDMILCARSLGLSLMIGGMVETELSMTASACLAGGMGGFEFIDLDTPLFMAERPLKGGFEQNGPTLRLDRLGFGHGVTFLGKD